MLVVESSVRADTWYFKKGITTGTYVGGVMHWQSIIQGDDQLTIWRELHILVLSLNKFQSVILENVIVPRVGYKQPERSPKLLKENGDAS